MPQPHTFTVFDDLQNVISAEMRDMKMWREIAESIASRTVATSDIAGRYQDALNCHYFTNQPIIVKPYGSASFSHDAFTHVLVATEIAQPDLQHEALTKILDIVAAMERYQGSDNDREFYTDMLNALGPRLHPDNQTSMLLWMFENEITATDENGFVYIAPNMADPDHCSDDYDDDIRFEAANILLNKIENSPTNIIYDASVTSWILSLANPFDHPRFIDQIALPEIDGNLTTYQLWVAPNPDHVSEVLCVDDDNPCEPKNLNMLMSHFESALAKPSLAADMENEIMNTIVNLGTIFKRGAEAHKNQPEFHAAFVHAKSVVNACNFS